MAYSQEISRQNKALFIFLLDQSFSMDDPMANSSNRKADELALAINGWLQNMVIACSKSEGFKDWFDIAVIGYGSDDQGNAIIEPALIGPLAGRELVSISEVAGSPARVDEVTSFMQDDETGDMIEMPQQVPVWIDAKTQGATPICSALVKAIEIIDNWIPQHSKSFPPIVINITDGESSEGDPIPYADSLKQRATEDGEVLFFNCCVSSTPGDPFLFRGNGELMPDQFARQLFHMSSVLPETTLKKAREMGQELEPNARGMAYNADMVTLIKFLDMGTRSAALR
jgi:hypothetical protein